jgi:quinol monooxygenase YgiN
MIIAIISGKVTDEQARAIVAEYKVLGQPDYPGLLSSYLMRSKKDSRQLSIITYWHDVDALEAQKQQPEPMRGPMMFKNAGVEPTNEVYDVVAQTSTIT